MKYCIKAINKRTNVYLIMTNPEFNNISDAKKFIKDFSKNLTKVGKLKVVKRGGRK